MEKFLKILLKFDKILIRQSIKTTCAPSRHESIQDAWLALGGAADLADRNGKPKLKKSVHVYPMLLLFFAS